MLNPFITDINGSYSKVACLYMSTVRLFQVVFSFKVDWSTMGILSISISHIDKKYTGNVSFG
jgi:hypothetical protein